MQWKSHSLSYKIGLRCNNNTPYSFFTFLLKGEKYICAWMLLW